MLLLSVRIYTEQQWTLKIFKLPLYHKMIDDVKQNEMKNKINKFKNEMIKKN